MERAFSRVHRTIRRLQAARAQPARRSLSPRRCSSPTSAATSTTAAWTAANAAGRGCWPTNRRPGGVQLGHQPALADRDRPRQNQRGRGPLHRRVPDRTRVELEHRHLDRHGDGWEAVRDGVGRRRRAGRCTCTATPRRRRRAAADGADHRPASTSTGPPSECSPTPPTPPASTSGRRVSSTAAWTGAAPRRSATHCLTTRRIGGRQPAGHLRAHAYRPTHQPGVCTASTDPIRAIVDVTVEPLDPGHRSRVTIAVDFEGHGIGKLLVPLVVPPTGAQGDAGQPGRTQEAPGSPTGTDELGDTHPRPDGLSSSAHPPCSCWWVWDGFRTCGRRRPGRRRR